MDLGENCIRPNLNSSTLAEQQDGLRLRQKSLVLLLSKNINIIDVGTFDEYKLVDVLDEDGKPIEVDSLQSDYKANGLKITKLDGLTCWLSVTFVNVTELAIVAQYLNVEEMRQEIKSIAALIRYFRDRLVSLKLLLEVACDDTFHKLIPSDTVVLGAINELSKLKKLTIKFSGIEFTNAVNLPILGQVEVFELYSSCFAGSIKDTFEVHLAARSEPIKRLVFDCQALPSSKFFDLSPKVAAMFTQLPALAIANLTELQQISSLFSNLTDLSILHEGIHIPTCLAALTGLRQLLSFSIDGMYPDNFEPSTAQEVATLPQLSTVKWFYLEIDISSHDDLSRWNIGTTFPNLQELHIRLYISECADCGIEDFEDELDHNRLKVSQCMRRQMLQLKQQCPQLRNAVMQHSFDDITCTLEDLADPIAVV